MTAAQVAGIRRRAVPLPAAAGIAYSAAWITGLLIAPSGTDVDSSGARLVRAYEPHRDAALAQAVLVHGVAGVALGIVVAALAARHRRGRAIRTAGFTAVGISLVQCVLEVVMFLRSVPQNEAGSVHALYVAVSRLDGLKMLALAALAALAISGGRRIFAPWLRQVGLALVVTIAASGIGYLFLNSVLAAAAFASLPLLLVWITGIAVTAGEQ